jgi:transposase
MMTAPLSQDLRRRLVHAVEAGCLAREAARRFEVSASAAMKLMQRVRQTGSARPARISGYRKPLLDGQEALLRQLTSTKRSITLAEILDALRQRGIRAGSLSTIWTTLRGSAWHKKSLRAAEQDRPDIADHRKRWRVWQRYMDPQRFVFLDETRATTNMARRYGCGPKSERLVDTAPHGHWRTTTFITGLRSTGLVAPMVLDGLMTGEAFRAYVEQYPLDFHLTGNEASDSRQFETLLDIGPEVTPRGVVGDKGYDAHANREAARARHLCDHPASQECQGKPRFFAGHLFRLRARIEQFISKIKRFKRVAMRCEKTKQNFTSIIARACVFVLVKTVHTA